jgi:hypothetical protein
MKIYVSQICEKPYSSKIVCTLLNQKEIAFCVLLKWYTKQCTTGTFLTVFLFYVNSGCKRDQSNVGNSEKRRIPQSFYIMST